MIQLFCWRGTVPPQYQAIRRGYMPVVRVNRNIEDNTFHYMCPSVELEGIEEGVAKVLYVGPYEELTPTSQPLADDHIEASSEYLSERRLFELDLPNTQWVYYEYTTGKYKGDALILPIIQFAEHSISWNK